METINLEPHWSQFKMPRDVEILMQTARSCLLPKSRSELLALAMGNQAEGVFEVAYDVPGKGRIVEAIVTKCRNGLAVNYTDSYMRRRDPECMVVADTLPTDKARFVDRFGEPFARVRAETFDWLKKQRLIVMPFWLETFGPRSGQGALLIAPDNTGFFAGGLADLQGMIGADEVLDNFRLRSIIYLAPPFRHTHFEGRQCVVHNRVNGLHEVFWYNLYPGPNAKNEDSNGT